MSKENREVLKPCLKRSLSREVQNTGQQLSCEKSKEPGIAGFKKNMLGLRLRSPVSPGVEGPFDSSNPCSPGPFGYPSSPGVRLDGSPIRVNFSRHPLMAVPEGAISGSPSQSVPCSPLLKMSSGGVAAFSVPPSPRIMDSRPFLGRPDSRLSQEHPQRHLISFEGHHSKSSQLERSISRTSLLDRSSSRSSLFQASFGNLSSRKV